MVRWSWSEPLCVDMVFQVFMSEVSPHLLFTSEWWPRGAFQQKYCAFGLNRCKSLKCSLITSASLTYQTNINIARITIESTFTKNKNWIVFPSAHLSATGNLSTKTTSTEFICTFEFWLLRYAYTSPLAHNPWRIPNGGGTMNSNLSTMWQLLLLGASVWAEVVVLSLRANGMFETLKRSRGICFGVRVTGWILWLLCLLSLSFTAFVSIA